MDVLSDVIAVMRSGEPRSARFQWHAPWGQLYPPVPGAGFQVILQGSCWLIPAVGDPIALSVGDVVFRPHGGPHGLADSLSTPLVDQVCDPDHDGARFEQRSAGPSSERARQHGTSGTTVLLCGAYQLDPARAHPLLTGLPEIVYLPARLGHRPELRAAVDLLAAELDQRRPGADALVPALLDSLLLYILRAWFEEQSTHGAATGWAAALRDPAVAASLDSVHSDPAAAWTVERLGIQAGLSRAAFARRFTALVGQPPLTYLTWWRMTLAARMLHDSDAPLSTVAKQVGYGSEFAFAAAFKRQYGTAPGKYRRQSQHRYPDRPRVTPMPWPNGIAPPTNGAR
jgi:AraC-like DNA-binding protein